MELLSQIISFLKSDKLIKTDIDRKLYVWLSFMFYCSIFAYYCVRNIKDTLVVDLAGSSNIISNLKAFGSFPVSIVIFFIYAFATNKFGIKNAFRFMMTVFAIVFFGYSFFIIPSIQPVDPLLLIEFNSKFGGLTLFGFSLRNFISTVATIFCYPNISLYYILSEIFGTMIVQVVFWQTVVSNLTVDQSKRLIPSIIFWGQFGTTSAGIIGFSLLSLGISRNLVASILTLIAGVLSLIVLYIFQVLEPIFIQNMGTFIVKREKKSMPISQALYTVVTNQYLRLIAVIVVSYGLCMGLTEICWKDLIADYCSRTGITSGKIFSMHSLILGICGILGTGLLREFLHDRGWFITAVATPLSILVLGGLFLLSAIFSDISIIFLAFAVILGLIQNICTKVSKYALFDASKEAAYIPLGETLITVGKPAVELIGGRGGKGLSGLIGSAYINAIYTSARYCIPQLLCAIIFLTLLWIWAVYKLNVMYMAEVSEHKDEHKDEDKLDNKLDNNKGDEMENTEKDFIGPEDEDDFDDQDLDMDEEEELLDQEEDY